MTEPNVVTAKIRDAIHPLTLLLSRTRVKYTVRWSKTAKPLPNKPMIFAVNHTNSCDGPVSARAISQAFHRRSWLLAGKQRLWVSDRIWLFLNGTIWVDRQDKADMRATKAVMCAYLKNGQAITWFPEGTWNLTDNLLMLPMKWGIIDVAMTADAQIIPTIIDYDRSAKIAVVRFGAPIAPSKDTSRAEAIQDLRDTMATLRWEIWEKCPPLKEYDRQKLKADIYVALEEYPPIDWPQEQKFIFKMYTSPEAIFASIDSLMPRKENAFLFVSR